MIRLMAYVSGRVQRVGYRARVVSLAEEMGLVGIVQNQPDGCVLVIAESEKKDDLERFASAIQIENALIRVENVDFEYTPGSGQYSSFKKVTGPNEVGERLDDGIEILKKMLDRQDQMLDKQDQMLDKQDQMLDKQDQMLDKQDQMLDKQDETISILSRVDDKMDRMIDKQDETIEEIRGLRLDLKSYMDRKFKRIEADLAELKEMKTALKEKGLI